MTSEQAALTERGRALSVTHAQDTRASPDDHSRPSNQTVVSAAQTMVQFQMTKSKNVVLKGTLSKSRHGIRTKQLTFGFPKSRTSVLTGDHMSSSNAVEALQNKNRSALKRVEEVKSPSKKYFDTGVVDKLRTKTIKQILGIRSKDAQILGKLQAPVSSLANSILYHQRMGSLRQRMVVEISGVGSSTGPEETPPKTVLLMRPEYGQFLHSGAKEGSEGDDGESVQDEHAHGRLAGGLSIQTESISKATAAIDCKSKRASRDRGQEGVEGVTTSPALLGRATRRNRKHESSRHVAIQNGDLLA